MPELNENEPIPTLDPAEEEYSLCHRCGDCPCTCKLTYDPDWLDPVEVIKCVDCDEAYPKVGLKCEMVQSKQALHILPDVVGGRGICPSCVAKRAEKLGYKVMKVEFE